jgi:hypothetical protein
MRATVASVLFLSACIKPGLIQAGTSWEAMDRQGYFNECLAKLAEDLQTVEKSAHVRELADLRVRK